MGSTVLQSGYFQVSTVTTSTLLVQRLRAPLCVPGSGRDSESPRVPEEGKRAFPISRLRELLSRLFQLQGVVELPILLLLTAR